MSYSHEEETAKKLLESHGWVVLREKSYRQAQERQRVAEARKRYAEQQVEDTTAWAVNCLDEERRLRDRLTYVYGVAVKHGATTEELAGSTGFGRDVSIRYFDGAVDDRP